MNSADTVSAKIRIVFEKSCHFFQKVPPLPGKSGSGNRSSRRGFSREGPAGPFFFIGPRLAETAEITVLCRKNRVFITKTYVIMKQVYLLFLMLCASIGASAGNWMKRLPDNMYVALVSIPGTHDSATGHGMTSPLGEMTSRTQDTGVPEQWAAGIRAFDLRPRVRDGYLHAAHGMMYTNVRFDSTLYVLRDSLKANPSEFVVIHLLYADNYENEREEYRELLLQLLQSDELKDYIVADFRRDLTVGDLRGKMLFLSREEYDTTPIGGFLKNWCGYIDWNAQRNGQIVGPSGDKMSNSPLYVQDLSDTRGDGQIEAKVNAIKQMLDFSTRQEVADAEDLVWVYNLTSAYCAGALFSTSNGYRENATYTNRAFIDYLKEHEAGPTGIVLMDYAGVDQSQGYNTGTVYATLGKELTDTLIANNFKYLTRRSTENYDRVMNTVERLRNLLQTYEEQIRTDCPDVAEPYLTELAAIGADADSIEAEADSLRQAWQLTESYTVDYTSYFRVVLNLLSEAKAAQAEYEATVGIDAVRTDEAGWQQAEYFSLKGEKLPAPRRGEPCIVRFRDGRTLKIRF